MPCPILSLPNELLLNVTRKLQTTSLCRIRQTCKMINTFAEENRFRISVDSDRVKWALHVAVDMREIPLRAKFFVYPLDDLIYFHLMERDDPPRTNWILGDPYKQLGGIKFSVFCIEYHHGPDDSNRRIQMRRAKMLTLQRRVLPILRQLRVVCEWLHFHQVSYTRILAEITNVVNFNRLQDCRSTDKSFEKVLQLRTAHCEELRFRIWMVPAIQLSNLIGKASVVHVIMGTLLIDLSILWRFIEEISGNPALINNLKSLTLRQICFTGTQINADQIPGAEKIWSGRNNNIRDNTLPFDTMILKFPLNEKQAIISEYLGHIEVQIVDNSREALFISSYPSLFQDSPYDASVFFNNFLQSENDQNTFDFLYTSYLN